MMNKEQLIDFLKDNLSIEYRKIEGSYGHSDIKILELKLGKEIISETYIND